MRGSRLISAYQGAGPSLRTRGVLLPRKGGHSEDTVNAELLAWSLATARKATISQSRQVLVQTEEVLILQGETPATCSALACIYFGFLGSQM